MRRWLPEVLVVTFVSPGGVVVMGEEVRLFCASVVLRFSSSLFLHLAVGLDVTDLVTVETLLVFLGIRLGISLVLVTLGLRLPLRRTILALTVFALAVLAFSILALEHGDVHWHKVVLIPGPGNGRHFSGHLVERVESSRMERQMVPDRRVLDASLEYSLPHVVSHGLTALFLVLPDQVPELFGPVDELSELPEVIQENLPEHADVRSSARSVPRTFHASAR